MSTLSRSTFAIHVFQGGLICSEDEVGLSNALIGPQRDRGVGIAGEIPFGGVKNAVKRTKRTNSKAVIGPV